LEITSDPSAPHSYQLITDPADFPAIAAALGSATSVALDLETFGPGKKDGLNPWRGDIRLLTLKLPDQPAWVIDLQATGYNLGELGSALEAVEIIAHNAKFDLLWLAVKCNLHPKRIFCTLTAARLLSAGTKPGNNLDQCLQRYLGIAPGSDHSTSDWGGMFLTPDQLAYAVRDVNHLHSLASRLDLELQGNDLEPVRDLEMQLLPTVVAIEEAGLLLDRQKLQALRDNSAETATRHITELRTAFASPWLNPASPDQLKAALVSAGINVPNTSEETLKASNDNRLIPLILAYRNAVKAAQQAESLLECLERDGRIHGRFEPTGTDTGRFSSRSPNLQNIGRGQLRNCFIAPEGSSLVLADYSQIELRVAAAVAGETRMIEAYRNGVDLHRLTAATVLDKPLAEVTSEDRQLAKSCNFGLIYGQSAKGLVNYAASAYGVTLSFDDAEAIRKAFFRTYGNLRQWHGESHRSAEHEITETRTALGRRRLIPSSADAWQRFTALVNTPVQGGAADGMKRALILLQARLPETARIVSTVHDEVLVECQNADAPAVRELVQRSMTEAMAELYPTVPIEAEAKICRSWGEK